MFFGLLGALAWLAVGKAGKLEPISVVTNIVRPKALEQNDGWTNVLLLGIDARPQGNAMSGENLTDTILVASFSLSEKRVLLTSIPRDLYIAETGTKVNAIYGNNSSETDPLAGISAIKAQVEKVVGLPLQYYVLIDFQGFIKGVDTLGGVDINVPETMDDWYYPIEGRENATCGLDAAKVTEEALAAGEDPTYRFTCRFEHLYFPKGLMSMDGALALKYARSRHAEGTAGSDFDRARRQQLVIEAAKDKALSLDTLINPSKLSTLWQTFNQYVQTNVTAVDLLPFYNAAKALGGVHADSIVLSDSTAYGLGGGLLVSSINENGLWVTNPRVPGYSEIHALIQKSLLPSEATTSAELK